MVSLSICVEQRYGRGPLGWPQWRRLAAEIEALGFRGMYVADHLPDGAGTIEALSALTWLADHSRRLELGALVSPVSVRHPTLLAWQAASLDDLSGGRYVVGVGTGWLPRDDEVYGFTLGDLAERTARLEEALIILRGLLGGAAPVDFDGRFYRLRGAELRPRPARAGGPPILVGGNGRRRILPLTARYADIWNGLYLTPDGCREQNARLDGLLAEAGRSPTALRRTLYLSTICGRDEAELTEQADWLRGQVPGGTDLPYPALLAAAADHFAPMMERMGASWCPIVGRPEEVVEQMRAYDAAGIDELILAWFEPENLVGLRILSEEVLPHLG